MKIWTPVEDGKHLAANPKDSFEIDGEWLVVHEVVHEGNPKTANAIIELPDDVRVCRATERRAVEVTEERVEALKFIVRAIKIIDPNTTEYFMPSTNKKYAHGIEVFRAMLAEMEGSSDGTQ